MSTIIKQKNKQTEICFLWICCVFIKRAALFLVDQLGIYNRHLTWK